MIKLVQEIQAADWEEKGSGFSRTRFLQDLSEVIARPLNNRVSAQTSSTAVALNGNPQSTGIGTGIITPAKYAEVLLQARATFNISATGSLYIYLYRTKLSIPANGAAPNAADVIVGGDAFGGPATVAAQNVIATLSFIDSGLLGTQGYKYYFAFKGTNGLTGNLINSSQLVASEF